jgi:hypothetical protein
VSVSFSSYNTSVRVNYLTRTLCIFVDLYLEDQSNQDYSKIFVFFGSYFTDKVIFKSQDLSFFLEYSRHSQEFTRSLAQCLSSR